MKDRISDKHIYCKCEEYKNKCKGRDVDKSNALIKKEDHNHPGRPEKLEVKKALRRNFDHHSILVIKNFALGIYVEKKLGKVTLNKYEKAVDLTIK
jgi:hypothetical protein